MFYVQQKNQNILYCGLSKMADTVSHIFVIKLHRCSIDETTSVTVKLVTRWHSQRNCQWQEIYLKLLSGSYLNSSLFFIHILGHGIENMFIALSWYKLQEYWESGLQFKIVLKMGGEIIFKLMIQFNKGNYHLLLLDCNFRYMNTEIKVLHELIKQQFNIKGTEDNPQQIISHTSIIGVMLLLRRALHIRLGYVNEVRITQDAR